MAVLRFLEVEEPSALEAGSPVCVALKGDGSDDSMVTLRFGTLEPALPDHAQFVRIHEHSCARDQPVNRHPRISQFAAQAVPGPTQRHRWCRRRCLLGRRRRFAGLPGSGGGTSRRRTLTTRSSRTSSGPASSFSFLFPTGRKCNAEATDVRCRTAALHRRTTAEVGLLATAHGSNPEDKHLTVTAIAPAMRANVHERSMDGMSRVTAGAMEN